MRNFKPLILSTAVALARVGAADSNSWQRYANRAAGYSIQFPAKPKVTAKTRTFFGRQVPQTIAVYGGLLLKDTDLNGAFDVAGRERQFLEDVLQASRYPGAKVTEPTPFTWQGAPGAYTRLTKDKMEMRTFTLIHNNHYIEICVCGMEGKLDMKAGQRFVESLRL